jgi:hypothetical protein
MLAQRRAGIPGAKQAAALPQRDHIGVEYFEPPRQQERHAIETVRCMSIKAVLDQVGDLIRRFGCEPTLRPFANPREPTI